jgi:hypothetical protein
LLYNLKLKEDILSPKVQPSVIEKEEHPENEGSPRKLKILLQAI